MACDQLIRSISITVLAPTLGELIFLIPFEHSETPDVGEIPLTASTSDKCRLMPGSNCEACELSLDAHGNRSVVKSWISSAVRNSSG